jgi:hypothetical protein
MDNVEVFSKYVVTNNEWLLYSSFEHDVRTRRLWGSSLGCEMMSVCLSTDGVVSDVVKNEVVKFNDVIDFYMRKIMRGQLFMNFSASFNLNKNHNVWVRYNVDPWNRQFPYFVDDLTSDYYNSSSDNKIRYGYWVFYKDRVVSSKSGDYRDVYKASIINNGIPLMILTTTSIEGVSVACLDIVEKA